MKRIILSVLVIVGLAACGSTGKFDASSTTTTTAYQGATATSPPYHYTPPAATDPPATDPVVDTSWIAGVVATTSDITTTLNGITAAANSADISGTISLCQSALDSSIDGWSSSFDSIPISSIREPAQMAISEMRTALTQCSNGEFSASADSMGQASTYLQETTDAANAISGGG